MWWLEPEKKQSHPSSTTTLKYVVRRTKYEHDSVEEHSQASSLDGDQIINDINMEVLAEDEGCGEEEEETVVAQNHHFSTKQEAEAAVAASVPEPTSAADLWKDGKDDSSLPPGSPTGVEEIDSSVFSLESFGTELFRDEKNPFRASPASNKPKFQKVMTSAVATSPSKEARAEPTGDDSPVVSSPAAEAVAPPVSPNSLTGGISNGITKGEPSRPESPSAVKAVTLEDDEVGQASASEEVPPRKPQEPVAEQQATSPETLSPLSASNTMQVQDVLTSKLRLYIDDYDHAFFCKIMNDIKAQPCVEKLDIHRSSGKISERKRTPADIELFFQVVKSLPNLATLHLSHMDAGSDLEHFHDAVFGHRKLQFVKLHMASGGIDASTLEALNTLPRLSVVTFATAKSFDFSPLLRSTTLRKLHITSDGSFAFEDSHIMSMVPVLECNRVLRELDLEPDMSFMAFKFLAYSMKINRSVEVLQVAIEGTSSQLLVEQAMGEIANVLAMNPTLRVLNNRHYRSLHVGVSSCRKILRAMETNVNIEYFHLFHEDATFGNRKREILRETDTSQTSTAIRSTGDGTTYRSFMASYYTQGSEGATDDETTANKDADFLPGFCGAFDSMEFTKADFARVSKQVFDDVTEQFSIAFYSAFGQKRPTKKGSLKSRGSRR